MMKKIVFLIILCGIIIISCHNRRENESISQGLTVEYIELINDSLKKNEETLTYLLPYEEKILEPIEMKYRHNRFPVSIEFDLAPGYMITYRRNMISRVIYAPESCAILNYYEVLSIDSNTVLDNPILNKNIFLPSTVRTNYRAFFERVEDILDVFGISLLQEDIEKFNKTRNHGSSRVRLEYMNLYITRSSDWFRLWMIEYDKPSTIYDFNIEIGTGKDEIISRFGNPARHSEEDDIFVYWAFGTLRSVILLFENNKVVRVQLTASDGI